MRVIFKMCNLYPLVTSGGGGADYPCHPPFLQRVSTVALQGHFVYVYEIGLRVNPLKKIKINKFSR